MFLIYENLHVNEKILSSFVTAQQNILIKFGITRITFGIIYPMSLDQNERNDQHIKSFTPLSLYTFQAYLNYAEDIIIRNIEPPIASFLDLHRLSNFNIQPIDLSKFDCTKYSKTFHMFKGLLKGSENDQPYYFIRAIVPITQRVKVALSGVPYYDQFPEPEKIISKALELLEILQEAKKDAFIEETYIYLNFLSPNTVVELVHMEGIIQNIYRRYANQIIALNIEELEICIFSIISEKDPPIRTRIIVRNPTGLALEISYYEELKDPKNQFELIFHSISKHNESFSNTFEVGENKHKSRPKAFYDNSTELHGLPISTPYPIPKSFQKKRKQAKYFDTTYCYDFISLFRKAIEDEWCSVQSKTASNILMSHNLYNFIEEEELVLDDEPNCDIVKHLSHGLSVSSRDPGNNSLSIIAWRLLLRTPEYPNGRFIILIVNDITTIRGSFSVREDKLFNLVSKFARENGLPWLFIAANSGARIGLAEEIKNVFKIQWIDDTDPSKGFNYLYVDKNDYDKYGPNGLKSIIASKVSGQNHYRIDSIIGKKNGLNVENLRGSGTIAGETARTYKDSFTLSYVTSGSIGIGSYLNRLGQRIIQKGNNSPILLTGYKALNSLMGSDVYSSNLQIGGSKIMYGNGISHQIVRNDLEGVSKMINWLSYIPERYGAPLSLKKMVKNETIDRDVMVHPDDLPSQYDPRDLLRGMKKENGTFYPGFFDVDSFQETLGGWAKSVITGRATLGGIPIGFIISENRTMDVRIPADPASPETKELVWKQAGQVFFPDSSFKTAQMIKDLNQEGLPLILFANWRGFSGGTRDMVNEIIKFGAQIVEALIEFKQPCFIHILPKGELRGGAWVVVDPTINPNVMEMTSDITGQGRILEPTAVASIKFPKKDELAAMYRLDSCLQNLIHELKSETDPEKKQMIQESISKREKILSSVYHQIAIKYSEYHDKPQRMLAKKCIRKIINWKESRRYFHGRLVRLLSQRTVCDSIQSAMNLCNLVDNEKSSIEILKEIFSNPKYPDWDNDKLVLDFLNSIEGKQIIQSKIDTIKKTSISNQMIEMGKIKLEGIVDGLDKLLQLFNDNNEPEKKNKLLNLIKHHINN